MHILGVDPGLAITGYGLIETQGRGFELIEAGVIKTRPKDGIEARLGKIHANLLDIITEHKPSVLVLEKLYAHYKHPTTAILMGHARGVICLVCGEKKIPLISYPSTRIKKAVSGSGHASKEQIGGVVKGVLGLKRMPDYNDITDAIAVALCHAYMVKAK